MPKHLGEHFLELPKFSYMHSFSFSIPHTIMDTEGASGQTKKRAKDQTGKCLKQSSCERRITLVRVPDSELSFTRLQEAKQNKKH